MQARLERLEAEVTTLRAEVAELRALLGVDHNDGYEVVSSGPPAATPVREAPASADRAPEERPSSSSGGSSASRSLAFNTSGETGPLQDPRGPSAAAAGLPRSQRDHICHQIGQWIAASLAGRHRGPSRRDQIPQGSKVWVVFRTFRGEDWNPPRAFTTFAAAKVHCKEGSSCGDAVFIGLPSRADVLAVCLAAGLPEPSYQ